VTPEAEQLRDLPLFEDLTGEELATVAPWFTTRHVEAGERLCGEGAPGYMFFVLRSGAASVTGAGKELAMLRGGDFFGELALAGAGRRTATVTATEPSELLVLYGTEFRRLEQEFPAAAERLRAAVEERLART
jgi:CRP/FNR family transcriptional regulator, cyclic AMP receptor protein